MNKVRPLFAISLVLLLVVLPMVSAQWSGIQYQYANGMITLTNNEIGIKVSAFNQVPHFQWWNLTDPGNDYHVHFLRIFEANDTNDDGTFSVNEDHIIGQSLSLPSANWQFSGFYEEHQNDIITAVHFNFTNTESFSPQGPSYVPTAEPNSDDFEIEIQIRVHFYLTTPQQFKFDIALSDWNWTKDTSVLVFQFSVAESMHGQDDESEQFSEITHSGNKFTFGNAYMEYAQNAFCANGTHQVQVKGSHGQDMSGSEANSIYLTFAHFEGNLEYDPILGLSESLATSIWDDLNIDYMQLMLLAGGLSLVALVVIGIRSQH